MQLNKITRTQLVAAAHFSCMHPHSWDTHARKCWPSCRGSNPVVRPGSTPSCLYHKCRTCTRRCCTFPGTRISSSPLRARPAGKAGESIRTKRAFPFAARRKHLDERIIGSNETSKRCRSVTAVYRSEGMQTVIRCDKLISNCIEQHQQWNIARLKFEVCVLTGDKLACNYCQRLDISVYFVIIPTYFYSLSDMLNWTISGWRIWYGNNDSMLTDTLINVTLKLYGYTSVSHKH